MAVTANERRARKNVSPNKERRNRGSRLTALDKAIEPYALTNSERMQRFGAGEVTLALAQNLARHYYPVCVQFPIFLAQCISRVYDEDARILLVENLYEEHGELDLAHAHPQLFCHYIAALDLDPILIDRAEKGSPADVLIQEYLLNISGGPEHVALAYLYSFEKHFSGGMQCIAQGFRKKKLVPEDALIFFDVHAVHDIKHAEKLQEALLRVTCTTKHWWEVCDAAARSAQLLYTLFDSMLNTA